MARSIAVGLTKGSNLAYLKVWGGSPAICCEAHRHAPSPSAQPPSLASPTKPWRLVFAESSLAFFLHFINAIQNVWPFQCGLIFIGRSAIMPKIQSAGKSPRTPKYERLTLAQKKRIFQLHLPAARWRGEFCLLFFEIFCSHELGFRKSHQKLPTNLACLHQPFNASFSIETGFKPRSIPLQISSWRKIMTANIKSRMWATIKTVSQFLVQYSCRFFYLGWKILSETSSFCFFSVSANCCFTNRSQ